MKSFKEYIMEKSEENENNEKSEIKFSIWKSPDNKVKWLKDDEEYQKICYTYKNKEKGIKIEFLLGRIDDIWHLWCGKDGAVNYDDDPYKSLKTKKFSDAIMNSVDKIMELINEIKENPDNYVQYYINK